MKSLMIKNSVLTLLSIVCIFTASMASAHTGLRESTPAANATLAQPPAEINLVFTAPVRLIRLEVLAGEKAVDTEFKPGSEAVASYAIPTPAMAAGDITVNWAAIGPDGHTVTNSFSFVVESAANVASAN